VELTYPKAWTRSLPLCPSFSLVINDNSNGGLKMIDIQSFSKSLKGTWIKKYLDEEIRGNGNIFFDVKRDIEAQ